MGRLHEGMKGNMDYTWLNQHYGHLGHTYATESGASYVLGKSGRRGWIVPIYDGTKSERKLKCYLVTYA